MKAQYAIGWDVGGWNCEKNSSSRDSIVILDHLGTCLGTSWRGNLREILNQSVDSGALLNGLFNLCLLPSLEMDSSVTLAIDTPLGFSDEFIDLVLSFQTLENIGSFRSNKYLFRETERILFDQGLTPMSAINHQIGSQATKGIHTLAKFAPQVQSCGVWTDGKALKVIEAYPSAVKDHAEIHAILKQTEHAHTDIKDAHICAAMALIFQNSPEKLQHPPDQISKKEGWIWTLR